MFSIGINSSHAFTYGLFYTWCIYKSLIKLRNKELWYLLIPSKLEEKPRVSHVAPTLICQEPSFFLNFLVNNIYFLWLKVSLNWFGLKYNTTYLNNICLSSLLAVATRGVLPVFSLWRSSCEEIIWVVISVSAAVPAPQQLNKYTRFLSFICI